MNRDVAQLWSDALGAAGTVVRYGHWGRPLLVFPTEGHGAWEFEQQGMTGAVAPLIEAGRLKVYCVDGYDQASWSDRSIPLVERLRRGVWVRPQPPPGGTGPPPRALRGLDHRPGRALDPAGLPGPGRGSH